MTSYNNNLPTESFDLVSEALWCFAKRISALKEQEHENGGDENTTIIEEINDNVIARDLEENAQRLEVIGRDFTALLRRSPPFEEIAEYVDSNERLIRFVLNVYANDLHESRNKIHDRFKRLKDKIHTTRDTEYKELFFNEFCKTENLDRLLHNIKYFEDHDLGRRLR